MRRLVFALTVLLVGGWSQARATTVAYSETDFSGTQGLNGWYYGYINATLSEPFTLLPYFGADYGDKWGLGLNPYVSGFALISPHEQHSNGLFSSSANPYEEWSVRRWVSSVDGQISIAGQFGCPGTPSLNDDGVIGEIRIDDQAIWSQSSFHETPIAYSASGTVHVGSHVDLILKPNYSDIADWTLWTSQISTVPEPSTFVLLGMGAAGPVAFAWRRRKA